jgi:hypothetical protein
LHSAAMLSPPCLVLHPAPLGVKGLELTPCFDRLPAAGLAPHCTASYDGHIPTARQESYTHGI